jgi:hypothetical protein
MDPRVVTLASGFALGAAAMLVWVWLLSALADRSGLLL